MVQPGQSAAGARDPIDKTYYICQTYSRLGRKACTSHKVEARDLHDLVLSDILTHTSQALDDSEGFFARLAAKLERRYVSDSGTLQRELDALTLRNREINRMSLSLYEDKVKDVLTEQRFVTMTVHHEQEQFITLQASLPDGRKGADDGLAD